ncbi:MAG: hypothetical protein K8E24_008740 [Methanobacterium paludis]|nr:hypothetical protein [Methanobacterium paludis]
MGKCNTVNTFVGLEELDVYIIVGYVGSCVLFNKCTDILNNIDPIEYEPDVGIKLIEIGDKIGDVDAIILPGTRNTISDLLALQEVGFTDEIKELSQDIPVFGLCGGYQMLGTKIIDETLKESKYGNIEGIGLLDAKTRFDSFEKIVTQSRGEVLGGGIFEDLKGDNVKGYELHEGLTTLGTSKPLFRVIEGCGNHPTSEYDGAVNGATAGTYFHGIFHNFHFRRFFTDYLRTSKGLEPLGLVKDDFEDLKNFSIDRLAKIFEDNVDMQVIDQMLDI